ncbi:hypothetical protein DFH08DRAFT_792402 [Mycena albidolilacea]|uniref:GATA-type domain-containing protein n=1 Tax=Mycena albidolilacea TaxID=1033008 RepID=A0AAD7EC18_9AGAR|nr:hypothetical protein DFH08DRAFT_792402 [Mycena albidolilacea]
MNNQRPYYTSSSSSRNIPYSSYSSLANAGMSYGPSTNQSNPSAGQYSNAMQKTSSARSHSQASPQTYPHGHAKTGYGMVGPAVPHGAAFNHNGTTFHSTTSYTPRAGPQYSNSMQYPGSQPQFPPSSLDEYILAVGGPGPAAPMSPIISSQHSYALNASSASPDQYVVAAEDGYDPDLFGPRQCYHCRATSTPLWRRDPDTHRTLCNACGLYLQQRHSQRPRLLIDAEQEDESDGAPEGPECNHCHTRQTSVWRRDKDGNQVCNACGVYQRLRGKERPLSLKRNKIKPRTRSPQT